MNAVPAAGIIDLGSVKLISTVIPGRPETSLFVKFPYLYLIPMKVRLIKKKSIEDFTRKNNRSRSSFRIGLAILKRAEWNEPGHIILTYGSADLLGNGSNRVVFDIAGNNYRMICKYHFVISVVHLYIKWIGTHSEYSMLCKNHDQYTVNNF